jgi:hypothetical protein
LEICDPTRTTQFDASLLLPDRYEHGRFLPGYAA